MIAIPNMDKPKSCGECWFYMLDGAIDDDNRWVSYSFCDLLERTIKGNVPKDCPIIEIGDIEYKAFKEFMSIFMSKLDDSILYGERRSDEMQP